MRTLENCKVAEIDDATGEMLKCRCGCESCANLCVKSAFVPDDEKPVIIVSYTKGKATRGSVHSLASF